MPDSLHLRAAGVSLLLDLRDDDARIVHWGADLGEGDVDPAAFELPVTNSSFARRQTVSLVPQAARGWRGTPGLEGDRAGRAFSPLLRVTGAGLDPHSPAGAARATLTLADVSAGLEVGIALRLDATGLLVVDQRITNTGEDGYALAAADVTLPVPGQAAESLDLTGRWAREKHPQRRDIDQGVWSRTGRHARTGHDSTLVIAVGTPGFSWEGGEVWAVHLGWSGDHTSRVERAGDGQTVLAVGELLRPGEVVLGAGETYAAPSVYAAYSGTGLNGVSERFHAWLRAREGHPSTPRPVTLNTWEAVYFRHDLTALTELADSAADLGVERFVLDDGWFLGRRRDTKGLGDWVVDPELWPDGLGPLIDHVRDAGLQFGLWVEPEMVNEDSEVIREHPDWVARPAPGRTSLPWRHQQVIDLANPDAWHHVFDQLDDLLTRYPISCLKWDQNRDQTELGHDGAPSVHRQTLAAYRLLDELRKAHPGVEIESCSSGGARVDLGILQRTDRVWASDTNDALERQTIQRWTGLVLPPELIGAHIGPKNAHTTHRTHDLSFRAITALFGHLGIESDVRNLSEGDRAETKSVLAFYKANRDLLHGGRVLRIDRPDEHDLAHGVVSDDQTRAVFAYVRLTSSPDEVARRLRLPGLDPERRYRVAPGLPLDRRTVADLTMPAWLDRAARGEEFTATGRALAVGGLQLPTLHPEHAMLLTVDAVEAQTGPAGL